MKRSIYSILKFKLRLWKLFPPSFQTECLYEKEQWTIQQINKSPKTSNIHYCCFVYAQHHYLNADLYSFNEPDIIQWITSHRCIFLTLLLFSLKSSSISSALSSSDTSPSSASADRYAGRRFPCREMKDREGTVREAPTWHLTHMCVIKSWLSCTLRPTQPALLKCSNKKHTRMLDSNAHLTVENGHFWVFWILKQSP